MRTSTAAEPKNKFGALVDFARATPVAITKYDQPVLILLAIEEFERLQTLDRVVDSGINNRPKRQDS